MKPKFLISEKAKIEKQISNIRNRKIDPNNIVLNSAAIQDQILIDMGLKKITKKNKLKKITKQGIINPKESIQNILEKIVNNKLDLERNSGILKRQRSFLNNLTYAQKIGLKEIEKMPLSIEEWKSLEDKTIQREDFKGVCPICLENLHLKESTLLSCTHVFHKICLRNFEKFTNTKKCPICRSSNYESKEYYKDKEYFILRNLILIQKTYRGFILRFNLYQAVFKFNMPSNKHLRSIYSKWKIKELTSKMCSLMDTKVKESTRVITGLIQEISEISLNNKKITKEINGMKGENTDWDKILKNMTTRQNDTCAICLSSLKNKTSYILDCSHCFHKNCLDSFEKYDFHYENRCPMCRRTYEKREIKFTK